MGVPPLAGFSSKWMLATSCTALQTPLGYLGAAALIASAILTAMYLMQIVMLAFFPLQHPVAPGRLPRHARRDPNFRMTLPLVVLAVVSVLLGLGAGWLTGAIQSLIF